MFSRILTMIHIICKINVQLVVEYVNLFQIHLRIHWEECYMMMIQVQTCILRYSVNYILTTLEISLNKFPNFFQINYLFQMSHMVLYFQKEEEDYKVVYIL